MAQHRHKRETNARRPKAIQVAGPIAIMATFSAVSLGVLLAPPQTDEFLASSASIGSAADSVGVSGAVSRAAAGGSLREDVVSRSESRLKSLKVEKRQTRQQAEQQSARKAQLQVKQERKATVQAVSRAATKMWTTTELNLWSGPESDAAMLGVLDELEKVLVTGRAANDRVEIVINDKSRWVSAGYLADEKPSDEPTLGGSCTNGSSVAGQANVIEVHRAVCAAFPDITSYGTYRGDGDHARGIAIDIMVSGSRGWEVAEFVRANYSALGVSYIIYSQNIWSLDRGGEGWRSMSDRGSTTANHYDHVHVTTY
ncbi:hypothetical protein [Nocardioides sp.]|uniref:hypothetical protein n=1 Tax=Nocardioides sp. TaxID=35761 RepID=UPI002CAF4704|nr:hypothetical protein [Nocardioides sp.]HXH79471.1 hypothetical protein [Nocardioides sp.]